MDIKYFIDTPFKVEFFKIKCANFKNKKKAIETVLEQYPENLFENFYSNRGTAQFTLDFVNIFKDEFLLIKEKYGRQPVVQSAWSVTYDKTHYHLPHNHGSVGYAGILYLQVKKDSPLTTYIQPWNNEEDKSVLYAPEVEQGDLVIVPQNIIHFTEPNKKYYKKRIISFDFKLK